MIISPEIDLLIIAVIITVALRIISEAVRNKFLDKNEMENLKKKQKEMRDLMKKTDKESQKRLMEIQREALDTNMKMMRASLPVMAIAMLVFVFIFPVMSNNYSESYYGKAPLNITLNATGAYFESTSDRQYQWKISNGSVLEGAVAAYSFEEEGLYTVSLYSLEENKKIMLSEAEIQVNNDKYFAPVARFNAEKKENAIEFDASQSIHPSGKIVKYKWDFGDGQKTEGINVRHSFEEQGNYLVRLKVTGNDGKTGEYSATVSTNTETKTGPIAMAFAQYNYPVVGYWLWYYIMISLATSLGVWAVRKGLKKNSKNRE